jgi:hypothetical protein
MALRRSLLALADAIVPPEVALFDRTVGIVFTQLVGAAARHRIADLLAERPLPADAIAEQIGTSADATHRMLRGLAALGVFALRADGCFENTRLSDALREGRLLRTRDWAEYFASRSNCEAWLGLEHALKSGKSAFEHVHGQSVWTYFEHHPDERETFARAMMGVTLSDASVVATLFPWREVKRVCDVGGGRGTLLSELLVRHPQLEGVLCDAEGVLASARVLLEQRGVLARVRLEPANFFERVPTGCDAYLLKNILHDWDNERCLIILQTVRRAMTRGARVLLVELLLERNESAGLTPLIDLHMMVACDAGRERSAGELTALLERSGFRRGRVFDGTPQSAVFEGIAE